MKKFFVLLSIAFTITTAADQQASETQTSNRGIPSNKVSNAIPTAQKQEPQYYSTGQQPQYYPVQYVQSPVYQQQYQQPTHQQPTMIIIAQPATQQHYLTSAAQQLLQYFHANPQARVQFLQGNFFPNAAQVHPQYVQQQTQQTPYYQLASAPQQLHQQQLQPQQVHQQYQVQQAHQYQVPQHTPTYTIQQSSNQDYSNQNANQNQYPYGQTSLQHISALAQLSAQKYVPAVPSIPAFRAPTPIITGLENFTPEQQAQIKEQLGNGKPFTPLKSTAPLDAAALQALGGKTQDDTTQDYQSSSDGSKSSAQSQTSNANYNYNTYNKG